MLAKSKTCAVVGLDGYIVEVEVDISPGLPTFTIVGLPDTAVQESRERVRSAIRNSGFEFPMRRITVNLAPADLRKAGPAYDLPIAVGVLLSSGQVTDDVSNSLFLGELSLDGSLRRTGRPRVMVEMLLLRMSYMDRTVELEDIIRSLGGVPAREPAPPAVRRAAFRCASDLRYSSRAST